ncbi:uncharacterized membrane protein YidH (DUF202 family) [Aquimarina sp. EL_43]|uniref:hypothetical protein n=1 Tax=Aquimarina TaxID=290174 RepID=UPI0004714AB5|nr:MULTISPECIES: hypothetical protein [Aquimarina]MBG6129564.1 uncharacterized membrane protein YidH (DUF202 family) [Aquimarina sp. EL_35]MBG6150629.1 uncharacterized membrane protein YidH (DUF202 family) [Aquimarina sp. EL_32]MBG6168063.1 uncharacterized membrane protein YidH (DUF202 family) [Aquimarina sp. EL_43]
MNNLNEFLGFITIIIAAILLVFIIARYNYLIKKAMIEKGMYLDQKTNKFKYLDIGCIVFGLGIGLLVSSLFTTMNLLEDTADLLVWGTILIFAAGGLVVAHFIRKKLEK